MYNAIMKAYNERAKLNQAAAAGSPLNNSGTTPGGLQRSSSFSLGNQGTMNVSSNLHIPHGRHRNSLIANATGQQGPGTPQSNGAAGSPLRMPNLLTVPGMQNAATPPSQQVNQMINQGIPVQHNRPMLLPRATDLTKVKPEMMMQNMDTFAMRQAQTQAYPQIGHQDRRQSEFNSSGQAGSIPDSKAGGVLASASWTADAAHDEKVTTMLRNAVVPTLSSGRPTLGHVGINRSMTSVPIGVVPDALRLWFQETDDAKLAAGTADPTIPGVRKRKLQEVADTVDKRLIIENDVEAVSVSLFFLFFFCFFSIVC